MVIEKKNLKVNLQIEEEEAKPFEVCFESWWPFFQTVVELGMILLPIHLNMFAHKVN